MSDTEIKPLQPVDQSAICRFYASVVNGNILHDDAISHIFVHIRNQLQCWRNSQNVMFRAKDSLLLCVSTLLFAIKKKLCSSRTLLSVIEDADFSLIVSIYLL